MAVPKTITWDIEPHTIAKHRLLEKYLQAWFPILSSWSEKVVYIDGFAGPGIYTDGSPGSPIIALKAAKESPIAAKQFSFLFIEADKKRKASLEEQVKKFNPPSNFRITIIGDEFEKILTPLSQSLKANKKTAPFFAFIDPFGFGGVPFELIESLLQNKHSEVLFSFMVESINRFIDHPNEKISAEMERLFGAKVDLKNLKTSEKREQVLRLFYEEQLRGKATFVRYFKMCGSANEVIYYLFFASNNRKGHLKMKEAMWKVDETGEFKFSDATNPEQQILFNTNHDEHIYKILKEKFNNKQFSCGELQEFIEDDTIFLKKHLDKALKYAEENDYIAVAKDCMDGTKRRKNNFKAEVIGNFK